MCPNSCCKNELNLEKLCVDCVRAHKIKSGEIVTGHLCAQDAKIKHLAVESEQVNDLCVSGTLQASQVSSLNTNTNTLCAKSATINSLCVNDLKVVNINHCEKWRATSTSSANFLYTLGSDINWDVIIDDPNGNIALAPFSYTVPQSGYYTFTFHVNHNSLTGSSVISGQPVGELKISVNGLPFTQQYAPFLSFSDRQKASLNSLVLLNSGDVIKMQYNVLVVDPVSGLQPYVGTVVIEASGSISGSSYFAIHYLSSLNCTGDVCITCPIVQVNCQPVTIECDPCNKVSGPSFSDTPCESC